MKKTSTRSVVEKNFRHLLRENEFKCRESGIYTININDEFLGWVGFPLSVKSGTAAVSPVIGVRHQMTHKILSQILEEDYHEYLPPTVSVGLGFLLPEAKWREWYFEASDDLSRYKSLVDLIQEYGSHFFKMSANKDSLTALLETFKYVKFKMDAYERLPILKYLNGNIEEAIDTLDRFISETAENLDPRAVNFRTKYAKNFRKMVYNK